MKQAKIYHCDEYFLLQLVNSVLTRSVTDCLTGR